jgi:hypothetical protein
MFYPNKKGMNGLKTILRYCRFNASLRWLWIGLLLVLHYEWLALYLSFSSSVGVQFAQSSSQWEARADTLRNVPNPADKKTWNKYTPLTLLSQCKLSITARNILFAFKNH